MIDKMADKTKELNLDAMSKINDIKELFCHSF